MSGHGRLRRYTEYTLHNCLIAAVYFTAGKAGLQLALIGGQVTPLWPPTGVALACLLTWGLRMWPGVALGAFLVNATLPPGAPAVLGIAVGSTLAAACACLLLRRAGFRPALDRLRDTVALIFLGALTGMLVSATAGTAVLALAGSIPAGEFWAAWSVWWTGDAMGVLVVTPLLLALRRTRRPRRVDVRRCAEAGAMLTGTAALALTATRNDVSILYSVFPFLIWAAVRFGLAGAALCTLIVSVVAAVAATHGTGPFHGRPLHTRMLLLQAFDGTTTLTALSLSALIAGRDRARERLTMINLTLQHSLLPQRLPDTPAVELASRYRPAESGVGGDWYDVIPLSGARVALVVGDVVGHGIHAAATMGRLRTAVRTLADGELPPDELLTTRSELRGIAERAGLETADHPRPEPTPDAGTVQWCVRLADDPFSEAINCGYGARGEHQARLWLDNAKPGATVYRRRIGPWETVATMDTSGDSAPTGSPL